MNVSIDKHPITRPGGETENPILVRSQTMILVLPGSHVREESLRCARRPVRYAPPWIPQSVESEKKDATRGEASRKVLLDVTGVILKQIQQGKVPLGIKISVR
jgi:hypothetical protein